jgi:hypothetical protein
MLFDEMIAIHEARGFAIRSSISPFMLSSISAKPEEDGTLTHIGKPGADWMLAPGEMSLTDLCFVEALGRARPAARILVLGGRSGWNAQALALANPGAVTAAAGGAPDLVFIDADPPGGSFEAAFADACRVARPDALYLFGRIVVDAAIDRFRAVAAPFPDRLAAVLSRTASGLGVLAPAGGDAALRRVVRGFCDPFAAIEV